jgi:hypothetical protein
MNVCGLLHKLTVAMLDEKCQVFYGNGKSVKSITVLTRTRHLTLSWADQSSPQIHTPLL